MSVGKTTLVNALKELPEFKDYHFRTERSKHLMNLGIPLNTDSTLKGQLVFASERAAELMQEKIITDRTVIDVMAFCELSKSMEAHEKHYLTATLYYLIKDYDILFYVRLRHILYILGYSVLYLFYAFFYSTYNCYSITPMHLNN